MVLAEQFRLIIPDRPSYPPNPPLAREDFEADARLIADMVEPDTHIVGFSYGGVIALFAAALCPDRVASLTVIEPPAFGLARGVAAADDLMRRLEEHWHSGIREPREFLIGFGHLVAGREIELPPDPLPPALAACRRGIRERQNLVKLTNFFTRNSCKKERKGVIGSVREAKSRKKERICIEQR